MPLILRKLAYLLNAREKRNAGILFALTWAGALFDVVGVGAIPAFVGVISMPDKLLEYAPVRAVYDGLGMGSTDEMVMWAAAALIVIFLAKNLYLAFLTYIRARYNSGRRLSISNRLFRAYLRSPYTFHLQRNTAELLRNTNSESGSVISGALSPVMTLAQEVLTLAFVFVLLMLVEPMVTLVVFGVLGSVTVAFYRATRTKIGEYAKESQKHRKLSVQAVNQGLGGFKDARILGRERFFLASYSTSTSFQAEADRFKAVVSALPGLFLETIAVAGMLGVSALLVAQDRPLESIIPTLTLLGVAIVRLMPSFQRIAGNVNSLKWGEKAVEAVYNDLVELEGQEKERRARQTASGPIAFEREIRFERLDYQYPGQAGHALRGVSLTIPKGAAVGFVGPSGAGKTTIVDVLLGLLDPQAGRVLVDGVDIQGALASWQRKIGYIPQSIYLTDDTVRGNVAFGMDVDEIDDNAVWRALDAAQLRETVEALPKGLDTVVGERGIRFSGGQRQRVGIARALYHSPEVLVMDEATSALDNQTERQFVEALERLQGNHTLVVIAHRLSTVRNCDTLFMLDHGRLVAEGSYDHLMAASEAFRAMAGEDAVADAMAVAEAVPAGS
ncbi:ABC transporter ATP-binding protein [Rubrivirga sp.]|uniref:ABC transporter ATP-binding protein n=1 Tax=Rubrivirga sp. TaxID=1885344 RepID=UPI003B51AE96